AGAFDAIQTRLEDPAVIGGAFDLVIDSPRIVLRLLGRAANIRSRLTGVPYGDQGIFIRRDAFERLGGYPEIPLMEDLELGRRMKRAGRMVFLSQPIRTSSRRWDREGVGLTTLRNQVFVLLYFLGMDPARLARWYRPIR
ncbi:MAG TPA: glycosyltransferase, partial [Nitrospiria bacterium]|nr:glycosyltransferase [Nitrospiria bacterium]